MQHRNPKYRPNITLSNGTLDQFSSSCIRTYVCESLNGQSYDNFGCESQALLAGVFHTWFCSHFCWG